MDQAQGTRCFFFRPTIKRIDELGLRIERILGRVVKNDESEGLSAEERASIFISGYLTGRMNEIDLSYLEYASTYSDSGVAEEITRLKRLPVLDYFDTIALRIEYNRKEKAKRKK